MDTTALDLIAKESAGKSTRVSLDQLTSTFGPDYEQAAQDWALTHHMRFEFYAGNSGYAVLTKD